MPRLREFRSLIDALLPCSPTSSAALHPARQRVGHSDVAPRARSTPRCFPGAGLAQCHLFLPRPDKLDLGSVLNAGRSTSPTTLATTSRGRRRLGFQRRAALGSPARSTRGAGDLVPVPWIATAERLDMAARGPGSRAEGFPPMKVGAADEGGGSRPRVRRKQASGTKCPRRIPPLPRCSRWGHRQGLKWARKSAPWRGKGPLATPPGARRIGVRAHTFSEQRQVFARETRVGCWSGGQPVAEMNGFPRAPVLWIPRAGQTRLQAPGLFRLSRRPRFAASFPALEARADATSASTASISPGPLIGSSDGNRGALD